MKVVDQQIEEKKKQISAVKSRALNVVRTDFKINKLEAESIIPGGSEVKSQIALNIQKECSQEVKNINLGLAEANS